MSSRTKKRERLEFKTKKKERSVSSSRSKKFVLSSRPNNGRVSSAISKKERDEKKKTQKSCLEFKTKKGIILSSRFKIPRNFKTKKGFFGQFSKDSGKRDSTDWRICILLARIVESYFPDLPWSVQSGIFSVADSESVYARNSGICQYSFECSAGCKLQNQCSQLEK